MGNSIVKAIINLGKALLLPLFTYLVFRIGSGGIFGTPATLLNNAVRSVYPSLIAWSMLFIIVGGNWDMSIGAQALLGSIIAVRLAGIFGMGIAGIITLAIAVSAVSCLIKAALNYFLSVPYVLLTIGLMLVMECFTFFLFNGGGASIVGRQAWLGRNPYCFIVLIIAFLAIMVLWQNTRFAAHVRALGANRQIAINTGINPKKTAFTAIMAGSFFGGLASVMYIMNSGKANPQLAMASMALCFDAMMPIFIGMTLQRYVPLPFAVIIGAFTMRMIGTGVLSLGIPSYMQQVVLGVFLILFMGMTLNQNKMFEAFDNRKRAAQIMAAMRK
jgi:ribose transport system permease protein